MAENLTVRQGKQTFLYRIENGVKQALIFCTSLIFWAVIGVHLSYNPTLVFGMIALYNEHLRDYWSILENESLEYGIWPGLLMVFRQEVFWILTITLGLTLTFWVLRRYVTQSKETLGELLSSFFWEQLLSLGVAIVACTLGAFLVGASFIFGVFFQTPISLEIAVIIEIVASSLLIFSLILSLSFFYFDLPNTQKAHKTARRLFIVALPISMVGLYMASQIFSLETQFTSDPPLPTDFRIYSADAFKNIQVGNGQGPEISVFDQVSKVGQTHLSNSDNKRFNWPNTVDGIGLSPMRSLYFAGSDVVPNFMPALFHRRPTHVDLDFEDRVIQVSYTLKLQRRPSQTIHTKGAAQTPKSWGILGENWQQRNISGPANGGWGTRLYIKSTTLSAHASEQVASYTIFATVPPRLETRMQDGTLYRRHLPFKGNIQSLEWHRQTAASLWVNNTPAFYFFEGEPQRAEGVTPKPTALDYTAQEFVPQK